MNAVIESLISTTGRAPAPTAVLNSIKNGGNRVSLIRGAPDLAPYVVALTFRPDKERKKQSGFFEVEVETKGQVIRERAPADTFVVECATLAKKRS